MNFKIKTLFISVACLMGTPALADSVENRIAFLENELNALKEQRVQDQQLAEAKIAALKVEDLSTSATPKDKALSTVWSDTNIKFYGIVRMDGGLDLKDTTSAPFVSNQLPTVDQPPTGNRSALTLTATRLGMDVFKKVNATDVKAKIEMDFWDGLEGNGKLRIRHAYVDFNHWLLGQTVSGMSNLETLTESVDYTLFMGYTWTRTPQIRYEFNFTPEHNLKVAAEYVDSRASELPAFTAKYVYSHGNFTGVLQGFINEKRATVNDKDIDKIAWGTGLGFKFKPSLASSVQAHWYNVTGDQKFVSYTQQNSPIVNGYASGGDFSVNNQKDDLDQNKVNTFVLGYSQKLSDQWRTNWVASFFNYDDSTDFAKNNPSSNKKLTDLAANVFYTPVQNVDIGLEYHHGKREEFSGREFDVSRVNLVTAYKF